ncbi:MAG: ASKHA domain-containing protein [Candidatus Thorarchaeota archaeon]
MSKKRIVFEPSGLRIAVDGSTTILDAARRLGLHISSECAGRGTCGKCIVTMEPAADHSKADITHISETDREHGIRLACEHKIQTDTRVVIPHAAQAKILVDGIASSLKWDIDDGLVGQMGIAIDLGTTTIVAYLMNMESGIQIGQTASLNPQVIYGEDVMSRITYADREDDGAKTLRDVVLRRLDELIIDLASSTSINIEDITRLSIVGNPAMHHLLLGLDTNSLGRSPFEPVVHDALYTNGEVLGLKSDPEASVYIAPNIAGFVGGDTAAFILSQRLDATDQIVLGIDIGTNGEIVLSVRGDLFCCSAAAGSAFEGATIRHGMRGQEGAIEHLLIANPEEMPQIFVIGNVAPKGLCGSAIVDVAAQLIESGIVESSGLMLDSTRVVETNNDKAYIIVDSEETGSERRIVFTQKDVRQVQLAKGAILAGASILMESAGIGVSDIDKLLLAGAFGTYIDPINALAIGLLPPIDIEKVIPVGNAAGEGAKRMLLSSKERALVEQIVKGTNYLELARHENFDKIFARATVLKAKMPL